MDSKIVKNTMYMYARTLIVLVLNLYISRVIINNLGIDNYGIYNVVFGLVIILGFLNSSMATASQRYLSFELETASREDYRGTFNSLMIIHIAIGIIIFILAESIGLWFLNYEMNFPVQQMKEINILYQYSIFTFLATVIQVPFRSNIIANENFRFYSTSTIVEVFLKLLTAISIIFFTENLLSYFGLLTFISSIVVFIMYYGYNMKFYWKYIPSLNFNLDKIKELVNYTSWNLFGNLSFVFSTQGTNILLNMFFLPIVNASMALALQIQAAINSFVANVQLAINPQIIKSYAIGDLSYMNKLLFFSSKTSAFITIIMGLPLYLNLEFIIDLWLGNIPKHLITFIKLILINILINSTTGPIMTAFQATGRIKIYQVTIGLLLLLNLPISYYALIYLKYPETVLYISISLSFISMISRLFLLKRVISFSVIYFFKIVISRIFFTMLFSYLLASVTNHFIKSVPDNTINNIIQICLNIVVTIVSIFILGLNKMEKEYIFKILNRSK